MRACPEAVLMFLQLVIFTFLVLNDKDFCQNRYQNIKELLQI